MFQPPNPARGRARPAPRTRRLGTRRALLRLAVPRPSAAKRFEACAIRRRPASLGRASSTFNQTVTGFVDASPAPMTPQQQLLLQPVLPLGHIAARSRLEVRDAACSQCPSDRGELAGASAERNHRAERRLPAAVGTD